MSRSCTPKAGSAGARGLIALWVLFAAGAVAVTSEPTSTGVLGRAPDAESLKFEPTSVYGVESKDVKLKYQFNDPDGDEESGSLFSWATADATGALIDLGSAASVPNVPEAAINQPLTACVTPKTDGIRTAPATGKQACITTTVKPPAPLVKDVVVKVKEADGLFIDTNNLSATYTWEGVGNDASTYLYGPLGSTASKLTNGEGVQTNLGGVPDFSMAGYAGRKLELGILPVSHYGGIGTPVVKQIEGYIYNPLLPPVISQFIRPTPTGKRTISAFPYQLDRAGGADGDKSTYEFYLGNTLVKQGKTINGTVPEQILPNNVYGRPSFKIMPVNGAGVAGQVFNTGGFPDVLFVDPNNKPTVSNVAISAPGGTVVGQVVTGSYTYYDAVYPLGANTRFAWREYRADSNSDKINYINTYGGRIIYNDSSVYIAIPPYTIPASLYGKRLELLVRAGNSEGQFSDSVGSAVTQAVTGTAPVISNPSAKPTVSITSGLSSDIKYQRHNSDYLYYTFKANGGNVIDMSVAKFYFKTPDVQTWTLSSQKVLTDGLIPLPCVFSKELKIEVIPTNGSGVTGPTTTVTTKELGLGPSGLGYCYDFLIFSSNQFSSPQFQASEKGLYVGSSISARYSAKYGLGMKDATKYSWNGEPFKPVVTPGIVPDYTIKDADVGAVIQLRLAYTEIDSTGKYTSSRTVNYTTDGFLSGIVIER